MSDLMPGPPTVLIVEDEPDIAFLLRELIQAEGFVVLTAADGAHALDVLRVCEVDLVVTDMMMPVMDGFAFLRAYAARPPPRAPVIAVSSLHAYLSVALAQGAIEAYDKAEAFEAVPRRAREIVLGREAPCAPPAPPAAEDEIHRLRAILDLHLDEPAPGDAMRRFTEQVARIFAMPICLISIVTADRQYWTASAGLPPDLERARGTPRPHSFCTHSVVGRTALVVQDAADSPFFRDNVLVQERRLRFYAGVPVTTRAGDVVGSLCLLDFRPRTFTHLDLELLAMLAKRAMAELEAREQRAQGHEPLSTFRYLTCFDEALGVLGREAFLDVLRVQACRAIEHREALSAIVIDLAEADLAAAARALEAAFPRGQVGRLRRARLGVAAMGVPAAEAERLARTAVGAHASVVAADVLPPGYAVEQTVERLETALDARRNAAA